VVLSDPANAGVCAPDIVPISATAAKALTLEGVCRMALLPPSIVDKIVPRLPFSQPSLPAS
jgi:hypothetical protein